MKKQPFTILGVEHVAIAVEDLGESGKLFSEILGISKSSQENIQDQKVITDIFETGNSKIELLKATSSDSPISNFINKRGQGIHHIAFKVDDIQSALDYCASMGIVLIDKVPRIGAEGLLIAFLHPKSTNGVLIELCQEPKHE